MLNSGEIQVSALRSEQANNVLSHYVFSTSIWNVSLCTKTEKEIKGMQFVKEEIKMFLFTDKLIV